MSKKDLGLIVMQNCKNLGSSVETTLKEICHTNEPFIIPIKELRFNNGEGKIVLEESVRGKDIYIISDVGNYGCTYNMFGNTNVMGPDEHFQNIKRVISACAGNNKKVTIITPLLYASRQHRRRSRESLDCAIALQELERLGVHSIVTFDAHDPDVQNAIPCLPFLNFYPTLVMLEKFIDNEKIVLDNLLVVAPDAGAMDRARYYADILKCDAGMFYKRRDVTVVIDGKNPIVSHEFLGKDVEGKDIIVVDDIIASGNSIIDVIDQLKERGANNIYVFCTFALFTKGPDIFNNYYQEKKFTRMYSTNLTYVPQNVIDCEWFESADCSNYLARIIHHLNTDTPITPLMNGKDVLLDKINNLKKNI